MKYAVVKISGNDVTITRKDGEDLYCPYTGQKCGNHCARFWVEVPSSDAKGNPPSAGFVMCGGDKIARIALCEDGGVK